MGGLVEHAELAPPATLDGEDLLQVEPPAPEGRALVLVVDDDRLNRTLIASGVRREGHRSLEAATGEAALELLASCAADPEAEDPDLVLLDIVMPGIDGFEVLSRLKADPRLRHLPVVVISSVEHTSGIARCIELGAEDFLPKPAEPAILRARLNAGLSKVRLHRLEQQRLRDSFARFVPEDVVDVLLRDQPGDPRIGARELVSTVLFNDLRGFTTFAQNREAAEVIDVLNEYLTLMSDTVLDHGGTLVSYLGDGMLSVFGAPVATSHHADRALAAAVEMREVGIHRLNAWLHARGLPSGLRIGIGLHSGPVMSGNVGSTRRMEYAAVGDTTNTAARVEAATKQLDASLLLTQETVDGLTPDDWPLRFVAETELRGRSGTTRLWTVEDEA